MSSSTSPSFASSSLLRNSTPEQAEREKKFPSLLACRPFKSQVTLTSSPTAPASKQTVVFVSSKHTKIESVPKEVKEGVAKVVKENVAKVVKESEEQNLLIPLPTKIYDVPPDWENEVFEDPRYNTWRKAMIEVLQEQPSFPLHTPKLLTVLLAENL